MVFEKAETPEVLQIYITRTLKVANVQEFIGYVIRRDYEAEWKGIVEGAFPLREAKAAGEGSEAADAFTVKDQRIMISKIRTTYRIAMGAEEEDEGIKAKQRDDELTADLEKPLDQALKEQLVHNWGQPS